MSIQGNIISSGSFGLFPTLHVTAPSGSTIDVLLNSVIIDSYTLSATETEHDFVIHNFSANTYTVRGTKGTDSKSLSVLVDRGAVYNVNVQYGFTLTYHFANSSELNDFSLSVPSTSTISTCTFSSTDCLQMYDTKTDAICSFGTKTNFKTLYPAYDCKRFKMRYYYTGKSNHMQPTIDIRTNSSTIYIRPLNSGYDYYLPYNKNGFIVDVDSSIKYLGNIITTGAWHTAEGIIDDDNHMKIYSDDTLLVTESSHEYKYIPSMWYSLKESWWNAQYTVYVDYIIFEFK